MGIGRETALAPLAVFKELPSAYKQKMIWRALDAMGSSIPPIPEGSCEPILEKGEVVYDEAGELKLGLNIVLKTSDKNVLDDASVKISKALGLKVTAKMPANDLG
jgi:hypothetical protein